MPRLMDSVSLANCQVRLPIFCPVPPRTSRISSCKICEGYQCFLFCLSFFSQFVYFLFYARFIYLMPFKCLLISFNLWDFCPQVPYKSLVLDDEVELAKKNSSQILFPWFDWNVLKPVLLSYVFRVKPLHQTSWMEDLSQVLQVEMGHVILPKQVSRRRRVRAAPVWTPTSRRSSWLEYDTSSMAIGFSTFHHRTPTDHNDPALPVSLFILWKSSIEDFLRLNIVWLL